jgi:hypothetical protein
MFDLGTTKLYDKENLTNVAAAPNLKFLKE